jgi:hypothetical protein
VCSSKYLIHYFSQPTKKKILTRPNASQSSIDIFLAGIFAFFAKQNNKRTNLGGTNTVHGNNINWIKY